jgi:Domain of unknown function (DUF4397)
MQPAAPRHTEAFVKRAASFVLIANYALITLGCGGSSSNSMMTGPVSPQVRVVQGGADTGGVDVLVNGTKAPTPATLLATPQYFAVTGSSIHVEEVASGTAAPAILDARYPVSPNSYNTVMIVGKESVGSLGSIALVDDHTAPPSGQIKLRLVNGASTIGPVDVYINNVGTAFPSTPTVANLDFKSSSAYLPLSAANFQVCMMPAGTPPGGGIASLPGVGAPACGLNLIVDVSAGSRNFTFAVFDPPTISSGNPGQFQVGTPFTVLMDLRQ